MGKKCLEKIGGYRWLFVLVRVGLFVAKLIRWQSKRVLGVRLEASFI